MVKWIKSAMLEDYTFLALLSPISIENKQTSKQNKTSEKEILTERKFRGFSKWLLQPDFSKLEISKYYIYSLLLKGSL